MKKTLAFGIVLLFIGIAFAPSLYADVETISEKKELMEIPIQICGLGGINEYTAKLSKEDSDRLDTLFVDIHSRLNASESREETISIYKDAVVELDNLGLLDSNCVRNVQELVNENQYEDSKCFVYGVFTNSILLDFLPSLVNLMPYILRLLLFPIFMVGFAVWIIHIMFAPINYMTLSGFISIGETYYYNDERPTSYSCSEGWIRTIGPNGVKEWNGSFLGDIIEFPCPFATILSYSNYNIGGLGFTGMKIGNTIFGFAQEVKLKRVPE